MSRALARALAEAQSGNEVRNLLDRTVNEPDGGFPLGSLLSVHLLTFAGLNQALLDVPVREAWIGLNMLQKRQIRQLTMQSFRNRGLVSQDGVEGDKHRKLVLHPYAALIMGARISPRFVLTVGYQGAMRGIRVFAIESAHNSADCYIMEKPNFSIEEAQESPFTWNYSYWLLPRSFLSRNLAIFAAAPLDEDSPFAAEPCVMGLYRPPVANINMLTTLEIYGDGTKATVLRVGRGIPEPGVATEMTVEELITVVDELLAS